jgi:signal transduction histidine kinase
LTRRIAISILLTVWLVLILAGALAYFVTRSMLVADLDTTLLARVASLPEVERPSSLRTASSDARDRYIVENQGRMQRPTEGKAAEVPPPQIIDAYFSRLADGQRIRTIKVKTFARRSTPADPLNPVTVVYSGPADRLDAMLTRLLLSLGAFGLLAGLATAAVAVAVAKSALRPLHDTADIIASIHEKNLDQRIPVERLPSELHPVGARLNDLLARLETAFAQRKQFLGDASHELRTPVAALMTTLEVTLHRHNRSTDEYVRALEACLDDARLLHQLVATLMDQVRSEQFAPGSEALDVAPVRLTAVLQHCATIARVLADQKKIQLVAQIPPDLTVLTDEMKVRSIVTNLLSNAVEYTPASGRVSLALEVLPPPPGMKLPSAGDGADAALPADVASPRLLRITIADTGPGIAAEHLPHLFEPFYRADKARAGAPAGGANPQHHLGLGLFLVRAHAARLGGEARVESALNEGATFFVDLPAAIIQNESTPSEQSVERLGTKSLQRISG